MVHVNGEEGIQFIKKTCKQTLDYSFCLTTLQADNRSFHANLTGLDAIAMEMGLKNATSTLSYISKLLNQKTDPYTKACLKDCKELYSSTIDSFKSGIENLGAKRYDDVNVEISAAMTNADTCETGFTDGDGGASPLTKQNQNLMNLGSLALAILKLIAQP
ncbi:putative invertase inhibitor [Nymphaea thermarum]|nr:putative invertase inhibitor [Nymphaea thermarum]